MTDLKRQVFNPLKGHLVTESASSSARVQNKLRGIYSNCFCELCGRSTEYSIAIEAQTVYKRLLKGNAKAVPITEEIRNEAQREADLLVERYERALTGELGLYEAGKMLMAYCDPVERRGDSSVATFRDQVERRMLVIAWAKRGNTVSSALLPQQAPGTAKPSKFYCDQHNPRRSVEARRAYQRDRRFAAEYAELIAAHWKIFAGRLHTWDIEAHAWIRKEAYSRLLFMKKPTQFIEHFEQKGIVKQADLARKLGISRQAVSAAIKRRALKFGSSTAS
jgi:hypothetical protein